MRDLLLRRHYTATLRAAARCFRCSCSACASSGPFATLWLPITGGEFMRLMLAVPFALVAASAASQTLQVPAKSLPVPDTVSPQMQKLIGAPLNPSHNQIPSTNEEWKKQIGGVEA